MIYVCYFLGNGCEFGAKIDKIIYRQQIKIFFSSQYMANKYLNMKWSYIHVQQLYALFSKEYPRSLKINTLL